MSNEKFNNSYVRLMQPEVMQKTPDYLYDELIEKILLYHPSADITSITAAYQVAKKAHAHQMRKSGEPYIIHPLNVAIILAELRMDKETIAASLLHDVVEDTDMTLDEIRQLFGNEIELLVDGVTKLERMTDKRDRFEEQAENLRKIFQAMADDIRVILIKLADRLHNMRTLQYQRPDRQIDIARETLEIYSPIAYRLGISKIKIELDDLSLKYLHSDVYNEIVKTVLETKEKRDIFIRHTIQDMQKYMKNWGIEAELSGCMKHYFSIYKKIIKQNKSIDQLYDIFSIKVIVDSIKDCYMVLGLLHEAYRPIPNRIKDYIAVPKINMYQSLHTVLIDNNGNLFQVQIRTHEMDRVAVYGITASWKYREGEITHDNKSAQAKISWLRDVLEWQRDMKDNREFMKLLKADFNLLSDLIYCYTPSGEVKPLPNGSTVIDFAYGIHSAVGNKMVGARVNGRNVPLNTVLQSGDKVEIITSQNSKGPNLEWLNIVKSTKAKNKINQWFKNELKADNIAIGKDMLEKYCKSAGIDLDKIDTQEMRDMVLKRYGFKEWNAILAAIGHGDMTEGQVANKLLEHYEKKYGKHRDVNDFEENRNIIGKINIDGTRIKNVRFSKCCNPIPGDEIVGYMTKGGNLTVHRNDCVNILNMTELERSRLVELSWPDSDVSDIAKGVEYLVKISIRARNRRGVLLDVTKVLVEHEIDIEELYGKKEKQGIGRMNAAFYIRSKIEFDQLIKAIGEVKDVIDVTRVIE